MSKQPKTRLSGRDRDLVRIATFILLDAAVFHDALASVDERVIPLVRAQPPLQTFLRDTWSNILTVDYAPVFEIARDVLLSFPTSPNTEAMLARIIEIALSVGASGVLTRHDFMGRIYHKLLLRTTGHYYATLYTSIPAAWLLANLVLKSPHADWDLSSPEAVAKFRVIDPACGSGTLLSAAYMAIKDLYLVSARMAGTAPDLESLHRALVEDVMWGWDVLDYAAHLTLTTLALHSNTSLIRSSNIYRLPVGVEAGTVHLGSLDLLKRQSVLVGHGFGGSVKEQSLAGSREHQQIEAPDSDVVIMNPPFSRSAKPNVKFGYTSRQEKDRLNKELAKVGRELGMVGIGNAGLGAHFMLLALELAKPNARIGLVIPRSMLSGVSWRPVREAYLQQTEIEYVVSNFDPGDPAIGLEGWNWSENTDLGEVLIVARKTNQKPEDRRVTYVNFWNRPRNEIESLLLGYQVIASRRASDSTYLTEGHWDTIGMGPQPAGAVYSVAQHHLTRNWLVPCVFAHPQLDELSLFMALSNWPGLPLVDLASALGRDIHPVKAHFTRSQASTTYPMVWGHQGSMNRISLTEAELGYGHPIAGESSNLMFAEFASDVLLAERPHPSTECMFAVTTPRRVMATAFWEVRLRDALWNSVFLTWFNCTYGILEYLAHATSSMGDIFKAKKDQIEAMRMPDPSLVDLEACRRLCQSIVSTPFATVAEEFRRAASQQGVRYVLDGFWSAALGLPVITSEQYELLGSDPVLTKHRAVRL